MMRRFERKWTRMLAAVLSVGAAPSAIAQSAPMLMPEGSKDIYLSLAAVHAPRANGSNENRLRVVPLISAELSNGVFINMNRVGMQLSEDFSLGYGPLFSPSRSRVPDTEGRDGRSRFTPEFGGFFTYRISQGLSVSSNLMYGGSSDRRGLAIHGAAAFWQQVRPHHSVGIETGLSLANRSSLQADFAVTPAQAGRLPAHEVHSGLRDASLSLHWSWELTHKTTLRTWAQRRHFLGSAGASPRIEQRAGTTVATMVSWRY
jgi:MipA family protein